MLPNDHSNSRDDENILQPLHVIQQLLLLCYYAGEIEATAWEHYLQQHPVLAAYCRGYVKASGVPLEEQPVVPRSCL